MKRVVEKLNVIPYKKLIWVLAISETLHNIEEAIWLPQAAQAINPFTTLVSPIEFRISVTAITLLVIWIIYYFTQHNNNLAKSLMGGTLLILLLNIFMPHIPASIATGTLFPGVVTGILLNVPVTVYFLWRGLREGLFDRVNIIKGSFLIVLLIMPLMAVPFLLEELIQ